MFNNAEKEIKLPIKLGLQYLRLFMAIFLNLLIFKLVVDLIIMLIRYCYNMLHIIVLIRIDYIYT